MYTATDLSSVAAPRPPVARLRFVSSTTRLYDSLHAVLNTDLHMLLQTSELREGTWLCTLQDLKIC